MMNSSLFLYGAPLSPLFNPFPYSLATLHLRPYSTQFVCPCDDDRANFGKPLASFLGWL
jgi:hypothetical protein